MSARRCPVCWRDIPRTGAGNIYRHLDSARKAICPMSLQPYVLMEINGTDLQGVI